MGWKEFLKPDKKKVVSWLLIFLFTPLPYTFQCIFPDVELPYILSVMCMSGKIFLPIVFFVYFHIMGDIILKPVIPIIYFIISYLLSCLIIWIYDKLARRRKIEV